MALDHRLAEPILVGSGELYIGQVDDPEDADEATIEAALTNLGAIESGATLTYSNEFKEIESANRGMIMRMMTKQRIEFETGIMSWNLSNLEYICPGSVDVDIVTGNRKLVIGKTRTLNTNYLRFIHTKADGNGELIINIYRASSDGGFNLTFDQENPVTVNHKFVALATSEGNLCEIIETFNDYLD